MIHLWNASISDASTRVSDGRAKRPSYIPLAGLTVMCPRWLEGLAFSAPPLPTGVDRLIDVGRFPSGWYTTWVRRTCSSIAYPYTNDTGVENACLSQRQRRGFYEIEQQLRAIRQERDEARNCRQCQLSYGD